MKKKINYILGVTLVEILIGIVISTVMMAAMFTSYNIVNSTYSQVTDTAKISRAGRDTVGMIMRDVRMAGYKYFGDNIETNAAEHIPIKITKHSLSNPCDTLEVVYGGYKSDGNDPPTFTYTRYKVTYKCIQDDRVDKEDPDGKTLYETYKLKKLQKAKHIWTGTGWGNDPDNDGNNETYDFATLVEYVEDLIFIPIDEDGKIINPPPTNTVNSDKIYSIKIVDILFAVRSKNAFFRKDDNRSKNALTEDARAIGKNRRDKFLRDTILVSAHARNLGLQ